MLQKGRNLLISEKIVLRLPPKLKPSIMLRRKDAAVAGQFSFSDGEYLVHDSQDPLTGPAPPRRSRLVSRTAVVYHDLFLSDSDCEQEGAGSILL